ncbi:MAG: carboxyl transferase domain-containing protein [Steroidobacteraceae bacterium]
MLGLRRRAVPRRTRAQPRASARSAATTCASGRERLAKLFDPGSTTEIGANISPEDPLRFKDSKRYKDRLAAAQKSTGERDALVAQAGRIDGLPVVACAFEFQFLGGSMGSVVGERFRRAVDHAIEHRMPLICSVERRRSHAGGNCCRCCRWRRPARALARLAQAHLPYISVLTDPTTGGVSGEPCDAR